MRRTREPRQPGFRLSPDVRASLHEGGLVLLHTRRGSVLKANEVGARIWAGLANGQALDEIASQIARDFGVDENRVRGEAGTFVDELRKEGLFL